jgi:hypothetical protein
MSQQFHKAFRILPVRRNNRHKFARCQRWSRPAHTQWGPAWRVLSPGIKPCSLSKGNPERSMRNTASSAGLRSLLPWFCIWSCVLFLLHQKHARKGTSVHSREGETLSTVIQDSYCDSKASEAFLFLPVSMATKSAAHQCKVATMTHGNRQKNHQDEELCFPGMDSNYVHYHKVFTYDYDLCQIKGTKTIFMWGQKIECQHAKSSFMCWSNKLISHEVTDPKEYNNRDGILMKKVKL